MESLAWQGWFTLATVALALFAMVRELAAPDVVMIGALFLLAGAGVLSPAETFTGFSNPAVGAIAALFIVSAALRETGALDLTVGRLLIGARTAGQGILRICAPVMGLSAFLNNAPIVAMMTPSIQDWARRSGHSPSRFLIPLSYAAILGSIATIIGTSVNLTVAALVRQAGMPELGFFAFLPVAAPLALVGLVYLLWAAPRLIPERRTAADALGKHRREYTTSMIVQEACPLANMTVEEAGLRQLPGLFLVEIQRGGYAITPVGPDAVILAEDRLVFAGVVSTIVDLQRIRGLVPISEEDAPAALPPNRDHRLVEVVVSASSPLVGSTIRDSNFRTVYDAAVIAVHRNGERVPGKLGEIELRPGDTLLMQTASGFLRAHRNSPDFYLVSELGSASPPRHERARLALGILAAMVLLVVGGFYPISIASFLAAGLLVLCRCVSPTQARRSVEWSVLIVIAASLGVAEGMQKSGAASWLAHWIVSATLEIGPLATLAVIYFGGLLMAETLHHNAAVAIMFPIAMAAADQLGVNPRGFISAVAISGACAFASPVTYQTHLIVYGPGGYRFTDFMRVGLPLDFVCAGTALIVIPWVWPF